MLLLCHALLTVPFSRQAACLGAKDPKTPLLALGCSALVNLLLDVYLVRVVGMGIGGAALATLAAQVVQACMLGVSVGNKRVAALTKVPATGDGSSKSANANAHEHGDEALRKKPRLSLLLRGRPSWPRLLSFVSFAGPMAFVLFGKVACYNAMTLAATSGGVITLAAHQVSPFRTGRWQCAQLLRDTAQVKFRSFARIVLALRTRKCKPVRKIRPRCIIGVRRAALSPTLAVLYMAGFGVRFLPRMQVW